MDAQTVLDYGRNSQGIGDGGREAVGGDWELGTPLPDLLQIGQGPRTLRSHTGPKLDNFSLCSPHWYKYNDQEPSSDLIN